MDFFSSERSCFIYITCVSFFCIFNPLYNFSFPSRVSVARGQVTNKEGTGLIGVRVSVATDPQFGFTLTRPDGW